MNSESASRQLAGHFAVRHALAQQLPTKEPAQASGGAAKPAAAGDRRRSPP